MGRGEEVEGVRTDFVVLTDGRPDAVRQQLVEIQTTIFASALMASNAKDPPHASRMIVFLNGCP